jgi:hypothetical protein
MFRWETKVSGTLSVPREDWKDGDPVTEIVCAEFTPPVKALVGLFDLRAVIEWAQAESYSRQ